MKNFQFAELNLKHRGNSEQTLNIVRRAVRMGYDAVVINTDIGRLGEGISNQKSSDEPQKKKRKKQQQLADQVDEEAPKEIVPDPCLVDVSKLDLASLEVAGKRFRQFSRLTVSLDANSVHKLQHHPKLKLYDIVAVRVPDEQLLLTLQRKGDFVDIVTLDGCDAIPSWLYKQKIVQACTAAGIHFELCYGNALRSSEGRRQFFAQARKLMEITRGGRGVVLSSGAEEMVMLRGPYDAANLSSLFGLSPKSGRMLVSSNVRDVMLRAQTRRTVKGAIHIVDASPVDAVGASTSSAAAIPSASGQTAAQTLQKLAKIPEFAAEMGSSAGAAKEVDEAIGGDKEEKEVVTMEVEEEAKAHHHLVGKKRKRRKSAGTKSTGTAARGGEVGEEDSNLGGKSGGGNNKNVKDETVLRIFT